MPVAGRRSEAVMKARRRRWSEGEKEVKTSQKSLPEVKDISASSKDEKKEGGNNALDRFAPLRPIQSLINRQQLQLIHLQRLRTPPHDKLELVRFEECEGVASTDLVEPLCEGVELRGDGGREVEVCEEADVVCSSACQRVGRGGRTAKPTHLLDSPPLPQPLPHPQPAQHSASLPTPHTRPQKSSETYPRPRRRVRSRAAAEDLWRARVGVARGRRGSRARRGGVGRWPADECEVSIQIVERGRGEGDARAEAEYRAWQCCTAPDRARPRPARSRPCRSGSPD